VEVPYGITYLELRPRSANISSSMTGSRPSEQDEPKLVELKNQIQIKEGKVIEAMHVPHWQKQTAQVHTIRKGDESNSEEDQDHNYRHGAEYWESMD
jgi:hypothetical protein